MKEKIELIDKIYRSLDFQSTSLGKYELAILQGIKNDLNWDALTDEQKLEYRRADLVHKKKVAATLSDLILRYEESVIELSYEILNFIRETETKFSDLSLLPSMPQIDIVLFRLRNMLYCELYAVNKHRKLEHAGHVLYHEVIAPLLFELADQISLPQYNIVSIKEKYEAMIVLYSRNPYQR